MVAPGEKPKPGPKREKEVQPRPEPPPQPTPPQRELEDWELPRKPGDGPRLPDPPLSPGFGAPRNK